MKDFAKSIRTGNAFDFDKRIISEREDSLRQAEESLKKAERDRNSHKGDGFFEEAYISAKNGVERARKNLDNARKAYIQTLERSKTGNSVPGSWKRIMLDGPAQQKDYKNYSIYVQEDKDEERGKTWWSWYVYKGDYEVAGGETNSEGSAKAAAESRLEGFLSRTGNSKTGNAKVDKEYSNGIKLVIDTHGSEYFWSIINRAGERVAFGMAKTYEKALSEGDAAAKRQEKRYTGNSKVGNSFESAKSEYEKAVREIESELKSAKPNIDKYFQIKERVGRTLSSERNNIQKELSAKISELIDMDSNISRLEDKFYK